MLKTTPLHSYHEEHAKLTEFAGYDMPLWYTATTEEHMAVRSAAGTFDVSHMGRFVVRGAHATELLDGLVPTAVKTQPSGKAFYTLLLNDGGGIIDDLIIEKLAEDRYLAVVNAVNAPADMKHLQAHAIQGVEIEDVTADTAMIAVQGPKAVSALQPLTQLELGQLKRFRCAVTKVAGAVTLVSRTGYTGEDGFEVIVYGTSVDDPKGAEDVWEKLLPKARPCGLGARDSLRLEAGFPLHGSDIDEETDPYEADLSWVITSGKADYVGASALAKHGGGPPPAMRRGLILDSGIPRSGFEVADSSGTLGKVTSGTFSPTVRKGIALSRLATERSAPGQRVDVMVRDNVVKATVTKPPFYDERLYGWRRQQP